jgi:hypothetical protein
MNQNLQTHVYDYAINMIYVVTGYTNKVFNIANKNFSPKQVTQQLCFKNYVAFSMTN